MASANEVFAIIDAQGFFVENIFYPREIAIVNNEQKIVLEILTDISIDTKIRCFKQFCFQKEKLHGLSTTPMLSEDTRRVYVNSELRGIVRYFYELFSTEEKHLFGVKNQQLSKWMHDNGFATFNLEEEIVFGESCPPLSVFESFKNSIYCPIHAQLLRQKFEGNHRCALRKAWVIWDWLAHKLKTEEFIEEISKLSLREKFV